MIESWGNSHYNGNLREETQVEVLQALEASDRHDRVGRLLFQAIRAADLQAIQNIMTVDNSVLAMELNGYEGTDLYDTFKSEDKKCYSWTGHPKDGYFYPLHVAAEAGNKEVCLHLLNGGASLETEDYIGRVPEQKANRDAKFAFYEHRGLKYEASERYVGGRDTLGRKRGRGILYRKERDTTARKWCHIAATSKTTFTSAKARCTGPARTQSSTRAGLRMALCTAVGYCSMKKGKKSM